MQYITTVLLVSITKPTLQWYTKEMLYYLVVVTGSGGRYYTYIIDLGWTWT